jgi:hypothetical protein
MSLTGMGEFFVRFFRFSYKLSQLLQKSRENKKSLNDILDTTNVTTTANQ